jgi:hexosaminidase
MTHVKSLGLTGLLAGSIVLSAHPSEESIIPRPVSVESKADGVHLGKTVRIDGGSFRAEAQLLGERLARAGFAVKLPEGKGQHADIVFASNSGMPAEGYILDTSSRGVTIAAADGAGAFWAIQTLLQLLPAELLSGKVLAVRK